MDSPRNFPTDLKQPLLYYTLDTTYQPTLMVKMLLSLNLWTFRLLLPSDDFTRYPYKYRRSLPSILRLHHVSWELDTDQM